MRMVQAGNCSCFALETLAQFSSIGEVIGKNFDGDDSVQTGVPGAVHLAHPACADGREDFVRAQALASADSQSNQ
jgi:hypothetical protein